MSLDDLATRDAEAGDLTTIPTQDGDVVFLRRPGDVSIWATRREADTAARALGWPPGTVAQARTRFIRRCWVLSPQPGEVVTVDGYPAIRARYRARLSLEHHTKTFEVDAGERYVTKSNGSCGRWLRQTQAFWVCTCGNGGANEGWASTHAHASLHREHPDQYPGQPWPNPAMVDAVRASIPPRKDLHDAP